MSNYGPAGGPYPDEPRERYEPPSDPWAGQDAGQDFGQDFGQGAGQGAGQDLWGGAPAPSYGGPTPPDAGHRPELGPAGWASPAPVTWDAPVPPRRRGASAGLVALLAVVVVLVLGGVGTAIWYVAGRNTEEGGDVRSAAKGDCVVNQGSEARPDIRMSACDDAKAFEIVARFDGTADYAARCKGVPGYTNHYFYDDPVQSKDFVLCLKRRS